MDLHAATAARDLDNFAVQDERAFAAHDGRLSFALYGNHDAALPTVRVASTKSFSLSFRTAAGLPDADVVTLIGAGLAHLTASAWTRDMDFERRRAALRPFIRAAVRDGLSAKGAVVSGSVRAFDLPAFVDIVDGQVSITRAEPHYLLTLGGSRSIEDFLELCSNKVRKTWRADLARNKGCDFSAEIKLLTVELSMEMAQAVAATSERNGMLESVELAEWRMTRLLDRPGDHFCAVLRQRGRVIGYGAWTVVGTNVLAHTFAFDGDSVQRGPTYLFLYEACLRFALSKGAQVIQLGTGHAQPKRARGCVEEPRWHVAYRPKES